VVQGDADIESNFVELEPVNFTQDVPGGDQCRRAAAARIVPWKERKNGIAHKLQHFAALARDGWNHLVKVGVQQLEHPVAGELVRYLGKATQVAKQQRCLNGFDFALSDLPGKDALGRQGADIGIEQTEFDLTHHPQLAGVAQRRQDPLQNLDFSWREATRPPGTEGGRAHWPIGIAERRDHQLLKPTTCKDIDVLPASVRAVARPDNKRLTAVHDLAQRAIGKNLARTMLAIVNLDWIARSPGKRSADKLRVKRHEVKRQAIDRQTKHPQAATKGGDQAGLIDGVAFIAREPLDQRKQRAGGTRCAVAPHQPSFGFFYLDDTVHGISPGNGRRR